MFWLLMAFYPKILFALCSLILISENAYPMRLWNLVTLLLKITFTVCIVKKDAQYSLAITWICY